MNKELLEFYILVFCLRDESFLITVGEYLFLNDPSGKTKKTFFSSKVYQIIFDLIFSTFSKIGKLPAEKSLVFLIEGLFKSDSRKAELLENINDICRFTDPIDFFIIEEATQEFIKKVMFVEALNKSQSDLENENYEAFVDALSKSINISFDEDLGVDIKDIEAVKEAVKADNVGGQVIPTGYSFLDSPAILNGGLRPGELGVIAANSGIGKTMLMCNMAINNLLDGKNVLMVSFETSVSRIISRVFSNLLGQKANVIVDGLTGENETIENDLESQFNNIVSPLKGTLIIKEYPSNVKSSNDIMAYLSKLKKIKGFVPDILYLDYLLIMSTNDKRMDRGNLHQYFKTITEEVRNIAKILHIVVWSATQINREGLSDSDNNKGGTKAIITSRSLSSSSGIEFTSDFLCTLSQTSKQKDKGEITCFVAKNRNGAKGVWMYMDADMDSCRFTQKV